MRTGGAWAMASGCRFYRERLHLLCELFLISRLKSMKEFFGLRSKAWDTLSSAISTIGHRRARLLRPIITLGRSFSPILAAKRATMGI